jgi:spore maturation protein CgeB
VNFVLFYHSFRSCWNHGNAHFLRGICRELVRRGHGVAVYEAEDAWSAVNALQDGGGAALEEAARLVPGVAQHRYHLASLDLDCALSDADVVLVHEWNDPELIARVGRRRREGGRFRLLFHDTHHCAVTQPDRIGRFDLDAFDAVLAFGAVLRDIYRGLGWGHRAFTWHEAADTALFRPQPSVAKQTDVIWVGNWGDGERDRELREFLIGPIRRAGVSARVHGVRYPDHALQQLDAANIEFAGWLPNHRVPDAFARARATVHVPRRPYVQALPGIPTIRVFEALACGIPLVSAPWSDEEKLFPPGSYVNVADGDAAAAALRLIIHDPGFAGEMAAIGRKTIEARHSCAHRVDELFAILDRLGAAQRPTRRATEATVAL